MSYAYSTGIGTAPAVSQRPDFAQWVHQVRVVALCAAVMFGPLAFGGVQAWAVFVLQCAAVLVFLLWTCEQLIIGRLDAGYSPMYVPLGALGLWAAAQLALRVPAYRYPTVTALQLGIAYGLLFFVAVQSCRSREDLRLIGTILVVFGFAFAVFSIVQGLTSNGKMFWRVLPEEGSGSLYGPYVNRNHYAGLMELLTPIALAWGLYRGLADGKRALLLFAGAVMAASILLSRSRGGIIALMLELAFLAVCVTLARRRTHAAVLVGLFAVAALALGFWLGGSHLLQRFEKLQDNTRVAIAKDALHMFARRPLTGWGLGSFESTYPRFRSFYDKDIIDHAHNDYAELLSDAGIAGAVLMLAFVVLLYRAGLGRIGEWDTGSGMAIRMGALAGCTGLLIHSFGDFNLHIPANAAMFLVMTAIASSQPPKPHRGPLHTNVIEMRRRVHGRREQE